MWARILSLLTLCHLGNSDDVLEVASEEVVNDVCSNSDKNVKIWPNLEFTNRMNNIKSYNLPGVLEDNLDKCAELCSTDDQCMAFSFQPQSISSSNCWLKSTISLLEVRQRNSGTFSGIKCAFDTPKAIDNMIGLHGISYIEPEMVTDVAPRSNAQYAYVNPLVAP